jgi:hypothetical protein
MTDLGKSRNGPKESDNRDKSLHGLIVALAMEGTIAGSVILFAYASSDSLVPDEAASAVNDVDLRTEPAPVIERVADKPADAEKIEYINDTAETETLVYTNATKVEEVPADTEEEEAINTEETEDEPASPTPAQPSEQEEENDDDLPDESELEDLIPKRLLDLLDDIADFEDEEESGDDDDKNKGKGKGHIKGDD